MHPEDGRVLWAGRNVEDLPAFHAQLVYLGHEPPLKADLTARENLKYWVGLRRRLTADDIDAALERVGASTWRDRPRAHTIGGPEKASRACGRYIVAPLPCGFSMSPPRTWMLTDSDSLAALIEEHVGDGGLVIAAVHQDLMVDRRPDSNAQLVRGMNTSALQAARLVLARDLRLALSQARQFVQPLVFFAIVTTLFPLSISPELSRLREIASGCALGRGAAGFAARARVSLPG